MASDNLYKQLLHNTRLIIVISKEDAKGSLSNMMRLYNLLIAQVNVQAYLNVASVWNLSSSKEDGITVVFAGKLSGSTGDLGFNTNLEIAFVLVICKSCFVNLSCE